MRISELPTYTKLIDTVINAPSRKWRREAVEALDRLSDEEAVPALITALQMANSKQSFGRLALLLAARPTPESVEELVRQVKENRRFPVIPLKALALCEHRSSEPALLQIMETGRNKQRRVAMDALAGRHQSGAAIEPLCRTAMGARAMDRDHSRRVLQRMGRPGRLALRALGDKNLSDAACAKTMLALQSLPVYFFPLSFRQFDAESFLVRLIRRVEPEKLRIEAVLQRIRDEQTLLRAAESGSSDRLLRSAIHFSNHRAEELLRASDRDADETRVQKTSWWRNLTSRK